MLGQFVESQNNGAALFGAIFVIASLAWFAFVVGGWFP
jgi:drug/metabolite transporter superfamily protein YnfA